ncbi:type II toxin-antitoxin system VapC family toxin [Deinococcus aquaedulcis]|uniref:type II toxin-antitoxin system VapC family toxin n=1 Tax=Deinococcus aquaedulcis TaxID=2840455 RepID=UPI001C8391E5|nr:PIN domain-containing protein [Deinococcus aquaedulcis]
MSGLVIVDSDVWSEAFRRQVGEPSPERLLLADLIRERRVQMLGQIRQEVLQGIRAQAHFERIRDALRAFPDRLPSSQDHERAAEYFNLCRSRGIQGSTADFLICACAVAWGLPVLTRDRDFGRYAEHLPLQLVRA